MSNEPIDFDPTQIEADTIDASRIKGGTIDASRIRDGSWVVAPGAAPRTAVPTQVQRPWRTTLRTVVQVGIPVLLGLGVVVPQIVQIILDEAGETLPGGVRAALLGVAAVLVAVSAILTRIMAIPQVELLLRRHRLLSWLAAERDATPPQS